MCVCSAEAPCLDGRNCHAQPDLDGTATLPRSDIVLSRFHNLPELAKPAFRIAQTRPIAAAVHGGLVGIERYDERFRIRAIVQVAYCQSDGVESAFPPAGPWRGESNPFDLDADETLNQDQDRGFVRRRFAQNGDLHDPLGTPPKTPLNHASPNADSPMMSWKCG